MYVDTNYLDLMSFHIKRDGAMSTFDCISPNGGNLNASGCVYIYQ